MKFRRQFEEEPYPIMGEVNDLPSETVQGDAMTIQEILQRSGQGIPVLVGNKIHYDGEEDFDNVDPTMVGDFDLADVAAFEREAQARRERLELLREAIAKRKAEIKSSEELEGAAKPEGAAG